MLHIESFAPLCLALEWDNVGLLIGQGDWEANKVYICLDVTPNAVEAAMEAGCKLILSHHPLIFTALKSINDPLVIKLIQHKIAVICLHTNLDVAAYSVNHALADALGLEVMGKLSDENGSESYYPVENTNPANDLGLLCSPPQDLTLRQLAQLVESKLLCPQLKLWTAGKGLNEPIQRIAICGGSGGSLLALAQAKADVYISGDISYHTYLDSSIPIIDAGHYYTEYPILHFLAKKMDELQLDSRIMQINEHEYALNMRLGTS